MTEYQRDLATLLRTLQTAHSYAWDVRDTVRRTGEGDLAWAAGVAQSLEAITEDVAARLDKAQQSGG